MITRGDLEQFNEELWLQWVEEGQPLIGNGDADFALKLFDLNQVGAGSRLRCHSCVCVCVCLSVCTCVYLCI